MPNPFIFYMWDYGLSYRSFACGPTTHGQHIIIWVYVAVIWESAIIMMALTKIMFTFTIFITPLVCFTATKITPVPWISWMIRRCYASGGATGILQTNTLPWHRYCISISPEHLSLKPHTSCVRHPQVHVVQFLSFCIKLKVWSFQNMEHTCCMCTYWEYSNVQWL